MLGPLIVVFFFEFEFVVPAGIHGSIKNLLSHKNNNGMPRAKFE